MPDWRFISQNWDARLEIYKSELGCQNGDLQVRIRMPDRRFISQNWDARLEIYKSDVG